MALFSAFRNGASDFLPRTFLIAFATWLALMVWANVCIRINAAIAPSAPIFVVLAFGALIAFRRIVFYLPWRPERELRSAVRDSLSAYAAVGWIFCLCVGLACVAFAGAPVEIESPASTLSGFAAQSSRFALPVYIAIAEEAAFRGQLQGRLIQPIGVWKSFGLAAMVFMGAHIWNAGFSEYWPLYAAISIVCGLLVADSRSVSGAVTVHASLNLVGVFLGSWVNGSAELLSSLHGRVILILISTSMLALFLFLRWKYISKGYPA